MPRRAFLTLVAGATLVVAAQHALAQAKLVETVIRICARNAASVVSCWALQSGGGWAVDQALTAAWNRISGQGGAKAAPATPPKPTEAEGSKPPPSAAPGVIDARTTRIEPLEPGKLGEALKGTRSLPPWLLDQQTKGFVVQTPRKPAGSADLLARDLNAHVGWKPLVPATPPKTPGARIEEMLNRRAPAPTPSPLSQLTARTPQEACRAERAQKAGLSLGMVALAPPDQRTALSRRWTNEVVLPCMVQPTK